MSIKSKKTKKTLKEIKNITKIQLSFGKLIWAIRKADELSQIDFATKLKISKQHLCDIEHERKSVSPKLASKYAKILGYSKEQFIHPGEKITAATGKECLEDQQKLDQEQED
jgi:transcriptional regulator with XRE-family HTH domain